MWTKWFFLIYNESHIKSMFLIKNRFINWKDNVQPICKLTGIEKITNPVKKRKRFFCFIYGISGVISHRYYPGKLSQLKMIFHVFWLDSSQWSKCIGWSIRRYLFEIFDFSTTYPIQNISRGSLKSTTRYGGEHTGIFSTTWWKIFISHHEYFILSDWNVLSALLCP